MTTDHSNTQLSRADVNDLQSRYDRPGTAGLVTAGAMTALLSGDVRLAVRATRLLIDDSKPSLQGSPPSATRLRRVWRRRS
jgi:hypothetical protein